MRWVSCLLGAMVMPGWYQSQAPSAAGTVLLLNARPAIRPSSNRNGISGHNQAEWSCIHVWGDANGTVSTINPLSSTSAIRGHTSIDALAGATVRTCAPSST